MKKIILSINSVVSWVLKILMLVAAGYFFIQGDFLYGIFMLLMLLVSFIPAIVNHSYDTNLPWQLDFWLTLWIFLAVAGTTGLYEQLTWWDDLLHFGGTAALVYLAFVLIYALNFTGKIRLSIPLIGFFTFLIGMAFGALWELAEFWTWKITGINTFTIGRVLDDPAVSLLDTFSDLQLDMIGAGLMAIIGMKYVAHQRHVKLREWMRPFIKIFGKKIRKAKSKGKS